MGANITVNTHMLGDNRVAQIVDPKSLDDSTTIQEAIDKGYVVGTAESVSAMVRAVMKGMVRGVQKDGDGRKVDGYFSLQPYANGKLDDPCDDFDRSKICVTLVARALKELQLDTSGWTITVEGSTGTLVINAISTGERTGEIVVGEDIAINGSELALGTTGTVKWEVVGAGKTGTVAAAKLTSDATRITVTGDALSELASSEYDGKTISFTVTIGNKKAVKSATLHYVG